MTDPNQASGSKMPRLGLYINYELQALNPGLQHGLISFPEAGSRSDKE